MRGEREVTSNASENLAIQSSDKNAKRQQGKNGSGGETER